MVFGINKASSYIAQYPVLRTVQSALHFTSLAHLFTQTPSRLLGEASSHMLKLMREGCSYTYPPLSIARYSFIQLSELEQCRVNKIAQSFNTAGQNSNPGSCSRESEVLPLSHCALHGIWHKNMALNIRDCVSFMTLEITVMFVSSQWGTYRTHKPGGSVIQLGPHAVNRVCVKNVITSSSCISAPLAILEVSHLVRKKTN